MSTSQTSTRLKDKVAMITGGASGHGRSIASLFLKHGAKVIIADGGDKLTQSLPETFKAATLITCNVTSDSSVEKAVDTAKKKYGQLDIMVNVASSTDNPDRNIISMNHENFRKAFEVNVHGAFLSAKHAARVMMPAEKGVILFASSDASVTPGVSTYAYAMSKHAVVGLANNLSAELGKKIRVNYISKRANATATPSSKNATRPEESADLKGVVVEAEDVAEAAVNLASNNNPVAVGGSVTAGTPVLRNTGFGTGNTFA